MSHLTLLVLDTSCSMRQKTSHHLSLLDLSKSAMERIILQSAAQNPQTSQNAIVQRRFLLSTCHGVIKNDIIRHMKSLGAWDLTRLEVAIRDGLKEMNKWRIAKAVDRFGAGRWTACAEPSCIIVFTDKGKLTSMERGTSDRLMVPMDAGGVVMQHQWCVEPFRWDQKVFGVVLNVPYYDEDVNDGSDRADCGVQKCTDSVLSPLCEVTGGACVQVRNMKQLFDYVDHLVQNVMRHDSVVVNFDLWFQTQVSNSSSIQHQQIRSPHTSIFIHSKQNYWPIPEAYFPTSKMSQFPPRYAHPTITIQSSHVIDIPERFPVDQYEINVSSSVAQFLIQNKISQNGLYRCYVRNSGPTVNTLGNPFGFVKAVTTSTQHTAAYFYVLPYNYPVLFKLLRDLDLYHLQQQNPSHHWKLEFEKYLSELPPYYIPCLKTALQMYYMKSPMLTFIDSLFPNSVEIMNYALQTQISNLMKQEKQENEIQDAQLKAQKSKSQNYLSGSLNASQMDLFSGSSSSTHDSQDFRSLLYGGGTNAENSSNGPELDQSTTNAISDLFNDSNRSTESQSSFSQGGLLDPQLSKKSPFEIHHNELLSHYDAVRCQLFGEVDVSLWGRNRILDPLLASKLAIARHSIPISEMGDYGAASKKYILRNPLSDFLDTRTPNFGSPYAKKKKKSNKFLRNLSIDEADAGPLQHEHSQKKQYAQRRERAQPKKKSKSSPRSDNSETPQPENPFQSLSMEVVDNIAIQESVVETNPPALSGQGFIQPQLNYDVEIGTDVSNAQTVLHDPLVHNNSQIQTSSQPSIETIGEPVTESSQKEQESKKRKRDESIQDEQEIEHESKKVKQIDNDIVNTYKEIVQIAPHYLELSEQFLHRLYNSISKKQSKKRNGSLITEIQSMIRAPLVSDDTIMEKVRLVQAHEEKFTKYLIEELINYSEEFKKRSLCERMKSYIQDLMNVS